MKAFERISQNPDVMGGKAAIRGMRVTVGMIVGMIGSGRSVEQVLADYPYVEREDVLEALRYAARSGAGERPLPDDGFAGKDMEHP